jgi:hypothetical protein
MRWHPALPTHSMSRISGVQMVINTSQLLCSTVALLVTTLGTHSVLAATPTPLPPGAPIASDFPGPFWEVLAPAGGSASGSNSHLFLNVPGKSNHGALPPSNDAVRVMQPIGNVNFDVSIKIDSPLLPTAAGTSEGLMVAADDQNFVTFAVVTDGAHIGLKASTVTGGTLKTVLDDEDFTQYQTPLYLRLTRADSSYVAFYSTDGSTWTPAIDFTDAAVPTSVGPFASNYSATPVDAAPVSMAVNWFRAQ